MANNWSELEVKAAVEDYFCMLSLELTKQKYNKTEHRRLLMGQLNNRTSDSVGLKHQNISAVLIEMGVPYIDGYKPLFNYQRSLLPDAVSDYLKNNQKLQKLFLDDSQITPSIPTVQDILTVLEAAPAAKKQKPETVAEPRPMYNPHGINYNPCGINYLEREAKNQSLGECGEQFVINFERARLIKAGKESLADRVEQVSATIGPYAGFDIQSFEESGEDRFIEAKTTKYGINTPFFVTPNELKFSCKNYQSYFLYRIFKYVETPRLYIMHGHLKENCILKPSEFIARPAQKPVSTITGNL